MSSSGSSDSSQAAGLNLGLAELVANSSHNGNSAAEKDSAVAIGTEVASNQQPSQPAAELTPLQKLAHAQEWGELARQAETFSSQHASERFEAKLFWILGQLRLKSMPLAILCAPLDSATREIVDGGLKDEARIKDLAGSLLAECGHALSEQGDSALACVLLDRARMFGQVHDGRFTQVVNSEIERLSKSRGVSLDERAKRIDELHVLKQDLEPIEARIPNASVASAGKDSLRSATIVASVISVALIFGFAIWRYLLVVEVEVLPAERTVLAKELVNPEVNLPVLQPLAGLGGLDAVLYEMGTPRAASRTENMVAAGAASEQTMKKEVVNTSYPLRGAAESATDLGKLREKAGSRNLTSAAQKRATGPLRRPLPIDPDPVAIEEFNTAQNYVVEASTEVMAKPSFGSAPLDRIFEGDNIRAEAKVGNWLKLRSKQGRVGYVSLDYVRPQGSTP